MYQVCHDRSMGYSKWHQDLYKLVDYRKWRYNDAKSSIPYYDEQHCC